MIAGLGRVVRRADDVGDGGRRRGRNPKNPPSRNLRRPATMVTATAVAGKRANRVSPRRLRLPHCRDFLASDVPHSRETPDSRLLQKVAEASRLCGTPSLPAQAGRLCRQSSRADVLKQPRRTLAHPSLARTAQSSGKKRSSTTPRRYFAPAEPPVPCFMPMMRSTILKCRKRHRACSSSISRSFSAIS
jgi:hypothetical protein